MGLMHCIINPTGRDGSVARRWPAIRSVLDADGWSVEEHFTERAGHATEIAWELRQRLSESQDPPLIVAVGGDGTVNEVASALRSSGMVMGIIPLGSGNDHAMAHGLHRKDIPSCLRILKEGVDRSVGAIRIEGVPAPDVPGYPGPRSRECDGDAQTENRVVRWMFQESDCGVTSLTSRAKLSRGKWIRGSLKYTYLGLTEILRWRRRKVWVKADDQEPQIGDLSMAAITMVETFGGGYRVSPGASPMAPHGQLTLAFNLSKLQMVRLMGPLRKGKHIGRWGITHNPATRLEIRALDDSGEPSDEPHSSPLFVQTDGEPCLQTPALLEFHPDQLVVRGAAEVPWE